MKKNYILLVLIITLCVNSAFGFDASVPVLTTQLTDEYPLEMPELKKYPIYINATVEDPDTIDLVTLTIDGETYDATEKNGFYYYSWTPSSYGVHEIVITAKTTNGDETFITKNIEVTNTAASQVIETLKDVVIEYGGENSRWYYGYYTLPQSIGAYDSINALFEVECPNISGGCDDWDRWAHIDIKGPDGNWIQIIRYITPYGVACNHEIDLTDYMSLLQGEVELRVFIDTWGTGGWQLSLNLDYHQGTPEYDYSGVIEAWDATYNFGDPANLQPVETYTAEILNTVDESYLRLSNTGHGWGENNTSNAAEFFNAFHYIDINTEEVYTQHLFKSCYPNPDNCTGQQGSWTYNRAGWCPGAISPPDIFDLSAYIGSSIDLDYRFHPSYVDNCHPNNADCVSGTTCPDCNAGYNPHYNVDGQIISKSHTPLYYDNTLGVNSINNEEIYDISVYPNPSNGLFSLFTNHLDGRTRVSIYTIEGAQVKVYYFDTNEELLNYKFDLSKLASGMYFINLENKKGTGTKKIILE
jgi:hypothetical protein